ncbi:MAG: hypothetical protein KatS3mg114_0698 [Planctomycetaceae bacterium]|nr:MAG: hypothetical protein KatS3mg114_0698 [Planctomycetaceae bacterium]
MQRPLYSTTPQRTIRRGAVIVWVILSAPVMGLALVFVIDIARLWVARTELKNALDAAALSAIKTLGEGGTTANARAAAQAAFSANPILGTSYSLNTAEGPCTNGNDSDADGDVNEEHILIGRVLEISGNTQFLFDCNESVSPVCPGDPPSIRIRRSLPIPSISVSFLGLSWGPYTITAEAFARYPCSAGPPQLLYYNNQVACSCP